MQKGFNIMNFLRVQPTGLQVDAGAKVVSTTK